MKQVVYRIIDIVDCVVRGENITPFARLLNETNYTAIRVAVESVQVVTPPCSSPTHDGYTTGTHPWTPFGKMIRGVRFWQTRPAGLFGWLSRIDSQVTTVGLQ